MDPLGIGDCGFCLKPLEFKNVIKEIEDTLSLRTFFKELNNFRENIGTGKTLASITQFGNSFTACFVCSDCNKLWETWVQLCNVLEEIKAKQKLLLERIDQVIPKEGVDKKKDKNFICDDDLKVEVEEFKFTVQQDENESEDDRMDIEGYEFNSDKASNSSESDEVDDGDEDKDTVYYPEKYAVYVKPTIDVNMEFKEELECPEEPSVFDSKNKLVQINSDSEDSEDLPQRIDKRNGKMMKIRPKSKLKVNPQNKHLKCPYCSPKLIYKIAQRDELLAHIQNEHSNMPLKFKCKYPSCDQVFHALLLLNEHTRKSHVPKKIKPLKKQKSAEELKLHCSLCGKIFTCTKKRKQHELLHDKKYVCELCPEACYSQVMFLVDHLYRVHEKDAAPEKQNHKCPKCSLTFVTQYMHNRHLNSHSLDETKPLSCPICFVRFKSNEQQRLERHKKAHLKGKEKDSTGPTIPCKSCERKFESLYSLYRHERRTHPELLIHGCTQCDKAYSVEPLLQTHLLSHSSKGPYKCGVCPANFLSGKLLSYHLDKHAALIYNKFTACSFCGKNSTQHKIKVRSDEKFYSCCQCEERFITSRELSEHLKTAHTELPTRDSSVQCEICGKSYINNLSLRGHIKVIHKRLEVSMCELCGKVLSSKSSLGDHMKTHNGQKNHECYHCGKCFVRKDVLRSHIYTHTGEKPYECYICQKRFNQYSWMKRHVETHRKDGSWFPKPSSTITAETQ